MEEKVNNTPDLHYFLLKEYRLKNIYGSSDYGRKKMASKKRLATTERKKLRELEVDNDTLINVLKECERIPNTGFHRIKIIEEPDTGYKHYSFDGGNEPNEQFITLLRDFIKQIIRLRKIGELE